MPDDLVVLLQKPVDEQRIARKLSARSSSEDVLPVIRKGVCLQCRAAPGLEGFDCLSVMGNRKRLYMRVMSVSGENHGNVLFNKKGVEGLT